VIATEGSRRSRGKIEESGRFAQDQIVETH
jgi:hypothetical protein